MARIRQFAKDMGLSYNKAKRLVNKGRKLKDGGSSILESTMNKAKMVKAEKGKITKIDPKGKNLNRAKMGQFNNIANAAREGKISPAEAQRRIQKLILAKRKESLQKEIKKTKDKSTKSLLNRELKAGGKKGINRNLLRDKFLTDAELKKKYPERYKTVKPSGRTYPYPGDKNPGKPTQKPTMTREEQVKALESIFFGDKK